MKKNRPELLAPAGNPESLIAAITNGADAVYLGLKSFSARAAAENFSIGSLKEACDYAHLFGARVYLTINTLIKNSEMDEAILTAASAWDVGISAVIIQDLSLANELKKRHPHIVLHASTQMGIHNKYGAMAAEKLGIERVILSRETSLDGIIDIRNNSKLELEHFVHGALCCGFSGSCYFSSLVAARSGNRGKCLQLCRKCYTLFDQGKNTAPTCNTPLKNNAPNFNTHLKNSIASAKNSTFFDGEGSRGYWLSTRDTMLARDLKKLFDAGVCSFKIEGRMRRKEYVAEAVRIYRKAIDNMENTKAITDDDIDNLKLMFNRGDFSKAHTFGVDHDIIHPLLPSHMGLKIGEVSSVGKDKAVLSSQVSRGDGLKFLRGGTEVGHALVLHDGYETGYVGNLKKGDSVCLTDSVRLCAEINKRSRRLPLAINASFSKKNGTCSIKLTTGERSKQFDYKIDLQTPLTSPLGNEDIAECLTRLGSTSFECVSLSMEMDEPFFAPKSALKQLRRTALADFESHLRADFDRPSSKTTHQSWLENLNLLPITDGTTIIMCEPSDAPTFLPFADYIAIKPKDYRELLRDLKANKTHLSRDKYILDLPQVAFEEDLKILSELVEYFDAVMVENIYGTTLCANKKILFGYKANLINDTLTRQKVASIEQKNTSNDSLEYFFGRPDIMQYVHCYYKKNRGCDKCHEQAPLTLTDDKGETYPIKKQKIAHCYNLLVSSKPINNSKEPTNQSSKDTTTQDKQAKRRFIDASNLTQNEKESLIDFLEGKTKTIQTKASHEPKFLD